MTKMQERNGELGKSRGLGIVGVGRVPSLGKLRDPDFGIPSRHKQEHAECYGHGKHPTPTRSPTCMQGKGVGFGAGQHEC